MVFEDDNRSDNVDQGSDGDAALSTSESVKQDNDENQQEAGERIQTSMLEMPENAGPMVERTPQSNTTKLDLGWRVQFKIGDQKKTLPLKKRISVGRVVEGDPDAEEINLDLTPFGAYHFGVSRNHAVMTLSNGYLYLEDLGSTNGTRINGFQLTANHKYRLRDGDEIEFARLRTNVAFKGPEVP